MLSFVFTELARPLEISSYFRSVLGYSGSSHLQQFWMVHAIGRAPNLHEAHSPFQH